MLSAGLFLLLRPGFRMPRNRPAYDREYRRKRKDRLKEAEAELARLKVELRAAEILRERQDEKIAALEEEHRVSVYGMGQLQETLGHLQGRAKAADPDEVAELKLRVSLLEDEMSKIRLSKEEKKFVLQQVHPDKCRNRSLALVVTQKITLH